ncbi:hypothetical protein D3C85_1863610 [compost metagenome]
MRVHAGRHESVNFNMGATDLSGNISDHPGGRRDFYFAAILEGQRLAVPAGCEEND